jgi:calcium/proton exchanger cax
MSKKCAVALLIGSTVIFCLTAHVLTDKIPHVIEQLGLSGRFIGLVFHTLITNAGEYMNVVKFSLAGNLGLSIGIGNHGTILFVAISIIVQKLKKGAASFTLIFPLIDVFCVFAAVLLRNSILADKSVHYFTEIPFLLIFLLISVACFFEFSS